MPNYVKGTRGKITRHDSKKRHYQGNQFTNKDGKSFGQSTSASAIIEFFTVFTALSEMLICSSFKQKISFGEAGSRGLGFKIVVTCRCGNREINSGPFINTGYEINRRIVFVMRLLGVAREGINVFCNLMDIGTGLKDAWVATHKMQTKVLTLRFGDYVQST